MKRDAQSGKERLDGVFELCKFLRTLDRFFSFVNLLNSIKTERARSIRKKPSAIALIFFCLIWCGHGSIKAVSRVIALLKDVVVTTSLDTLRSISFPISICYDTLRMYLRLFKNRGLREMNKRLLSKCKERGLLLSARFPGMTIAVIDGTRVLNSMYACVLSIAGMANFFFDFTVFRKGKELVAAQSLLAHFTKSWIFNKIDVLLADALYLSANLFRVFQKRRGKGLIVDIAVKIKEREKDKQQRTYRKVLKTATQEIKRHKKGNKLQEAMDVREIRVRDKHRKRKFKVYAVSGLSFAGVEVLVCYVIPQFRWVDKKQKHRAEAFYVVTTLDNARLATLLVAERWQIEEHFDVMKNEFMFKHDFIYKGNRKAFRKMMLIVMIAMNMVMVYRLLVRTAQTKNLHLLIENLRYGFYLLGALLCERCNPEIRKEREEAVNEIMMLLGERHYG